MSEKDKYYLLLIMILVIAFSAFSYSIGSKNQSTNAASDIAELNPVPDYINVANSGKGISTDVHNNSKDTNKTKNNTKTGVF